MSFRTRLQKLREASGLSQEALARKAGLSVAGLRNLEQGRIKDPQWSTVQRLASALGVSADQLADLDDKPEVEETATAPAVELKSPSKAPPKRKRKTGE
jgi:transcriptional regulator with XRE-family HTH domain